MSIKGLILRFCLAYGLAIFLSGAIARMLELKGISNVGLLFAAALYACSAFSAGNRRRFHRSEKWQAASGMLLVDLLIQLGAGWATTLGMNETQPPHFTETVAMGSLFIALVHAFVILGALSLSEKIMGKHQVEVEMAPPDRSLGGQP